MFIVYREHANKTAKGFHYVRGYAAQTSDEDEARRLVAMFNGNLTEREINYPVCYAYADAARAATMGIKV